MRASDLQQLELVGHDTATGFPVFAGHRMMVTDMAVVTVASGLINS